MKKALTFIASLALVALGFLFGHNLFFWLLSVYCVGTCKTYCHVRDHGQHNDDPVHIAYLWPLWLLGRFVLWTAEKIINTEDKTSAISSLEWEQGGGVWVADAAFGYSYVIYKDIDDCSLEFYDAKGKARCLGSFSSCEDGKRAAETHRAAFLRSSVSNTS